MNRKPGDWNCPSCDHLNFSWRESCQRCSDPKRGSSGGVYDGRTEDRRSDEGGDYGRRSGRSSYGFGSSYNSGRGRGGGGAYGGSGGGFYDRDSSGKGDYRGSSDYGSTRGYGDRGGDYRSNEYGSRGSYGGSYGGGSDMRPGDWYCVEKSCGAHNFASRTNCFKCGATKDDKEDAVDGRGRGYESGWSSSSYERRGGGSYYDQGNTGGSGRAGWKSGDWMCTRPGCNEHNFASRMECFRCQSPRED